LLIASTLAKLKQQLSQKKCKNPKLTPSGRLEGVLILNQNTIMPKAPNKKRGNITRYDYKTTSFNGFRVAKSFCGTFFQKYYSVKDYGSVKNAEAAAKKGHAALIEVLDNVRLKGGKLTPTCIKRAKKALIIKEGIVK
jgi:hypothetical protein